MSSSDTLGLQSVIAGEDPGGEVVRSFIGVETAYRLDDQGSIVSVIKRTVYYMLIVICETTILSVSLCRL
jgi:hypothetical protein